MYPCCDLANVAALVLSWLGDRLGESLNWDSDNVDVSRLGWMRATVFDHGL